MFGDIRWLPHTLPHRLESFPRLPSDFPFIASAFPLPSFLPQGHRSKATAPHLSAPTTMTTEVRYATSTCVLVSTLHSLHITRRHISSSLTLPSLPPSLPSDPPSLRSSGPLLQPRGPRFVRHPVPHLDWLWPFVHGHVLRVRDEGTLKDRRGGQGVLGEGVERGRRGKKEMLGGSSPSSRWSTMLNLPLRKTRHSWPW